MACANPYGWNVEERGVDGDVVQEVDPIAKALIGHGDTFNSFEMQ